MYSLGTGVFSGMCEATLHKGENDDNDNDNDNNNNNNVPLATSHPPVSSFLCPCLFFV
jgi:hypothetical protein